MGLASASTEVVNEMRSKHPQPSLPPSPAPPQLTVEEATVLRALQSFPTNSAPGPSRFSAVHFKEAVFCPSPDPGNSTPQAITCTVNLLCAGQVPQEVSPHLCGATLLACKKKGGGHHPIAVGEVLRQLVSKCLSRSVQADALSILSGCQDLAKLISQAA